MPTFQQWLTTQTERNDNVGNFAFTILKQEALPIEKKPGNEHQQWARWLVNHDASWDVLNAFNMAWKEYQITPP